jgi:leucyl-tRNA synthetase
VLYDAGYVDFVEPFQQLRNQGMLLAYTAGRKVSADEAEVVGDEVESEEAPDEPIEDWKVLKPDERDTTPEPERVYRWVKMSKSLYNVVTPDEMAEKYGADSLRLYGLFVAPFEDTVQWTDKGIEGASRFLNRVWRLWSDLRPYYQADWRTALQSATNAPSDAERSLRRKLHQTIRKVGEDLESFRFNTCVAALMEFTNELSLFRNGLSGSKVNESQIQLISEILETLPLIMSPITPHSSDEMWDRLGKPNFTFRQRWPVYDATAAAEDKITIIVQVNGKVRDRLVVPVGTSQQEIERLALDCEKVARELESGKQLRKVIPVPNKLVNFVIS